MTKDDLKYGYIVELRNRDKYLVVRNLQRNEMKLKNLDDGIYEIAINEFDNGLRYGTYIDLCCSNRFDIMKIYKDYTCKELLWERKEKPHLTDDEKAILRNIDKKYTWIARDKNGMLFVFTGKPVKRTHYWKCEGEDYEYGVNLFNHLFQSIQWEDEEPYLIEDLLKGIEND